MKQRIGGCHPKLVGFGPNILGRMQLTIHATHRTRHGASRLVIECEPGPAKPGVLRPGFVGMRGLQSYGHDVHEHEYTPPCRGMA